ncbi:hypothetical protein [Streptomyces sp. NRRL F-5053]|uniref:hypothetical protein n=1 Tax=Streptomyces sp. NRRL F-5053 TaxID=1463854 RepID=UPI0004C73CF7|nr:hypothetical protein [Streptomyces sp. NRRL F-5053]
MTPHRFSGVREIREALFPTHTQAVPYMLLLGARGGIIPYGLTGLGLGDVRWSGRQTMLLSYAKGRTAEARWRSSPG